MAPPTNAVIEVHQLTKKFAGECALERIDMAVERGRITAILGPNGAGKTTLLRILATLTRPTSGRIIVNGKDLDQHATTIRRHIGIVTHETLLYGRLTAWENLHLFAKLYAIPVPRKRIDECLRIIGLTHLAGELVQTLSRGTQQRLAIARAILHDPDILLLDEPYNGLDQAAIRYLDDLLLGFSAGKKTILMTTHDIQRLDPFEADLLILLRGRIARWTPFAEMHGQGYRSLYEEAITVREGAAG